MEQILVQTVSISASQLDWVQTIASIIVIIVMTIQIFQLTKQIKLQADALKVQTADFKLQREAMNDQKLEMARQAEAHEKRLQLEEYLANRSALHLQLAEKIEELKKIKDQLITLATSTINDIMDNHPDIVYEVKALMSTSPVRLIYKKYADLLRTRSEELLKEITQLREQLKTGDKTPLRNDKTVLN